MKQLIAAAVLFSMTCVGAWAETITEYEARTDTTQDGMYVLFVSRPVSENSPAGDAFMTLGKGASVAEIAADINYGIIIERGIPKLRALTDEEAASIRTSESAQPVLVSAVRIDQAQYDQIKSWLDEWAAKTTFDIPEANAFLDCTQEVIGVIGFKRPYRAGLLTPHIMNYYGDIQIVNRKKAV